MAYEALLDMDMDSEPFVLFWRNVVSKRKNVIMHDLLMQYRHSQSHLHRTDS